MPRTYVAEDWVMCHVSAEPHSNVTSSSLRFDDTSLNDRGFFPSQLHHGRSPAESSSNPASPALPSAPEHSPPPVNLLEPIVDHDPQLNRRIHNHLWEDCADLEHVDRAILRAVLQHMTSPPASAPPISMPDATRMNNEPQPEQLSSTPTIIDRILSLPVDQLKLLSNLFTVALTDARSWGGLKPKSGFGSVSASPGIAGSPTMAKEDPLVIYHTLFTSLGVPMLPTVNNCP